MAVHGRACVPAQPSRSTPIKPIKPTNQSLHILQQDDHAHQGHIHQLVQQRLPADKPVCQCVVFCVQCLARVQVKFAVCHLCTGAYPPCLSCHTQHLTSALSSGRTKLPQIEGIYWAAGLPSRFCVLLCCVVFAIGWWAHSDRPSGLRHPVSAYPGVLSYTYLTPKP